MRSLADTYDLSSLTELSEEAICRVLQERYNADRIYTLVGDILVFLNPFKPVGIYTEQEFGCLCRPDWTGPVAVGSELGSTAHIYTVGTAAFNLRCRDSTILISGESGSGKTESTKQLLQQFVRMSSASRLNRGRVAECLLAANPVMEAFGNARTVMNHNSSRFAKFVSLGLQGGALVSSEIRTYMLEKSRLVSAEENEGNFHVFYYMCLSGNAFFKDVVPMPRGPLALVSNLETLGQRYVAADLEDKTAEMLDAFDKLGFSAQHKTSVFQILSGLLLLGNVQFRAEEQNHTVCTTLDSGSEDTFKQACKHLGLKGGKDARRRLLKTLTSSKLKINEEDIYSMFQEDKTRVVLNGCIRAIYARLFDWIIRRVNECLSSTGKSDPGGQPRHIGVLDIFGFESLAVNSFEQLCINLANEQLQLFFTHHVIQMEQAEYQSEGLAWADIPFEDNQVTLDLFLDKPLGVLSLLNEESSLVAGTDESLYHKMMKHLRDRPKLAISNRNVAVFAVSHYAGSVAYTIPGMVSKNRDKAPEPTIELLAGSKMKLMVELFSSSSGKARVRQSGGLHLAVQFRSSLDFLLTKLRESQPFFVRCIKPNRDNAASSFCSEYVTQQIRYCGIAEAVRVRQAGYPVRCGVGELRNLYPVLCRLCGSGKHESDAARVRAVLKRAALPPSEFALGRTKVFLRAAAGRQLAAEERAHLGRLVVCQKLVRGFLQRRRFVRFRAEELERRRRAERERQTLPVLPTTTLLTPARKSELPARDEDSTVGVTHSETVHWFQATQKDAILQTRDYNTWFHGIISRQESNNLLMEHETGSFLVRVSNSRLGFVLSFKSKNGIRHYLVEQLDRGRFNVLGEKQIHSSLGKMVEFHKANGFRNCDTRLTQPVGQKDSEPDYEELFCNTAL